MDNNTIIAYVCLAVGAVLVLVGILQIIFGSSRV